MNKKILLFENVAEDFIKYRYPYALYLLDKGFQVHAFIPYDSECNLNTIGLSGIFVHEYSYKRNQFKLLSFFKVSVSLFKVLKQHKIDVLHSFRFYCNAIASIVSLFCKIRLISTVTGLGIVYSIKGFKSKVLRIISALVYNLLYLRSYHIIFQNPDDIKDILASNLWSQKKYSIVNGSGVDIDRFSSTSYPHIDFRNKYGISTDSIIFTCVSRIIYEKGIIELLEAFKRLSSSHPSYVLILAGWPDTNNPRCIPVSVLEHYSDIKNIFIAGKISDIPSLLFCSDVFIFPSYYREGIPRSILEALASSLPIITTDMPGCKETVTANLNGLIIQPRSIESIISAITEIVSFDLVKMGEQSRKMAVQKYSSISIFKSMSDCYTKN